MLTLSSKLRDQLEFTACQSIKHFHAIAFNKIVGKVDRYAWEPNFVAHLCASMPHIASAWRPILATAHPKIHLNLSTIFTHQTPYVVWPSKTIRTKRCELADLLIAIIDRTQKRPRGVAILIQAKQSDNNTVSLTTESERKQFELLTQRNQFDVDAKRAPLGVNLNGRLTDSALLYGLTSPASLPAPALSSASCRWETAHNLAAQSGKYCVKASECLATTMVGLLAGSIGWNFNIPPTGGDWTHFQVAPQRDDWAMLINYLLERSFAEPVEVLRRACASGARRREDLLSFSARTAKGYSMFFQNSIPHQQISDKQCAWLNTTIRFAADPAENREYEALWSPFQPDRDAGEAPPIVSLPGMDFYEPENGPISAIVFEISGEQKERST
jgi:hypothetical protein